MPTTPPDEPSPGQNPRKQPPSGGGSSITERLTRLREALGIAISDQDYRSLWEHQRRAFHHLTGHFAPDTERSKAIVVIPPAGGKTRIFIHLLKAHTATTGGGRRPAVLLAPTQNLVRYALEEFAKIGVEARLGWTKKRHPVHVMTYDQFQKLVKRNAMKASDIDLLVMNEGHRGLSELRRDTLDKFDGYCPILAFTGTPSYNIDKTLYQSLGAENVAFQISATELRNAGILTPAINYMLCVSLEGTPPKDKARRDLVIANATRSAVLEFYRTFEDPAHGIVMRDKPYIAFHDTCDDAQLAADSFNASRGPGGRPSYVVAGHDKWEDHKNVLLGLRDGANQGVHNAKVLLEGPNFPNVEAVLNYTSTGSLVRESQRCGRAMAVNPDHPERISVVLDVFVEVNGRVQGAPCFYFETIEDESIARIVRQASRSWLDHDPYAKGARRKPRAAAASGTHPGPASGTGSASAQPAKASSSGTRTVRDPQNGYLVSSRIDKIRELLQNRDRYAQWRTAAEILTDLPHADRARADALFSAVECALDGLAPREAHDVAFERIILRAGRHLRQNTAETVYDRDGIGTLTKILDEPRDDLAVGDQWTPLTDLMGEHPDDETKARAAQFRADYLVSRRRGESGLRLTLGRTFVPPILAQYALIKRQPTVLIPKRDWDRVRDLLLQTPI